MPFAESEIVVVRAGLLSLLGGGTLFPFRPRVTGSTLTLAYPAMDVMLTFDPSQVRSSSAAMSAVMPSLPRGV